MSAGTMGRPGGCGGSPVARDPQWAIQYTAAGGSRGVVVCSRADVPKHVERLTQAGHKVVARVEKKAGK